MKHYSKLTLIAAMTLAGASAAIPPLMSRSPTAREVDAEVTEVNDWASLKKAVKNAAKNDTIRLSADVTSDGGGDDRLVIDGGEFTLDLYGHSIDRKRTKSSDNGHAIEVKGKAKFTLTNSSDQASTITGGYAENGGAINIHEGSVVTINNIQFANCFASSDGGAIFNRGELHLTHSNIHNCEAKDTGGAIYNTDKGWFEIDNTTIADCVAKNDGGAINAYLAKTSKIRDSVLTRNVSKTEDGGAISLDDDGKLIEIYDTVISDNQCEDNGGGIDVENGSIKLFGVTLKNNSGADGGAIYFDGGDDDVFEIGEYENPTLIQQNYASKDGGGLFSLDSKVTLNGGQFEANVAAVSGGGLRIKDGKATLNGTKFSANETQSAHGGAIHLNSDAVLDINGGSFTDNYAAGEGGAIYFHKEADKINLQGKIAVEYNRASCGPDIYLCGSKTLSVVGSLEGSSIGVMKVDRTGNIATGYADHNTKAPSTVFFANDTGLGVELVENKVVLNEVQPEIDPYLEEPFVADGTTVDARKLTGANWMGGISGDRYLNEINIPGTHDTAMRVVAGEAGVGSSFGGADYAVTQKRFVKEQLEEGVRYMDIRLHNRWVKEHAWYTFKKNELIDDGKNLWQTHGKTKGGTYWAGTEEGDLMNLNMILEWVKAFLIRNPSECLIMGFGEETYRKDENPLIRERLYQIVSKFVEENPTNPATGRPLVYLENGDLGATYTHMPQLRDVRGMILLETDDDYPLGGFRGYGKAGMKTAGQKTDRLVWWDKKLEDVNSFFADPEHQIALPKAGQKWDHANTLFKIGLNCAPQDSWTTLPEETPIYHSNRLLPALFFDSKGAFNDIQGKYVGWVKTDGATGKEWNKIWRSNFFQGDEEFATIIVNPNLDDPNYQTKQYKVPVGSEITVPDFNYKYDERAQQNFFQGWKVGEDLYVPGQKFQVDADTTFVAVWAEVEVDREVSIDIVFRDCQNVDGLRPNSMDLLINGSQPLTLTEEGHWHGVYEGILQTIVPNWELISGGDHGSDTPTTYRYELSGDAKNGFTLTFIHTSVQTYDSFAGQLTWIDQDDYDKLRPADNELSIGLIDSSTGEEVGSHTFAGGDWSYDLGANLPQYRDGKNIIYLIQVKDSSSWASRGEYLFNQVGFDIFAFHEPTKTNLTVDLRWADDGSSRPDSVTIHILANGVEVQAPTLSETVEEEGRCWHGEYLLDNYDYPGGVKTEIDFTIEVEVDGYEVTITNVGNNCFDVLLQAEGQAERIAEVERVIELIDAIAPIEYTKACIARIEAAKTAFEALSEENKALVTNQLTLFNALREFEQKFAHMVEIDAEILQLHSVLLDMTQSERRDALGSLGKRIIDLPEEERNALFNVDVYGADLSKVASWQHVINLIDAIGDVTSSEETKARIDAASSAYDALASEDKPRIENYPALIEAKAEYFAKYFLDTIEDALAVPGARQDVAGALVGIWNEKATPDGTSFREMWNALPEESRTLLVESDSEYAFGDFRAQYVEIMTYYSATLKEFPNGPEFTPATPVNPVDPAGNKGQTQLWIGLAVLGGFALLGGIIAAIALHNGKKKHE